MSQGPLCPNLSQKVQKEVSKMANHNLSPMILLGGLSVNLNHLKSLLEVQAKWTGRLLRAQVKRDKGNIVNPGQKTGSIFSYVY